MQPTAGLQVALTYPGQGGYSAGLLARLDEAFPEARDELSRIRAAWLAETGEDFDDVRRDREHEIDAIADASVGMSQIALFAACRGLYRVLEARLPRGVVHVGHSLGEIAALTSAGTWSVEDGVRVVAARVQSLTAIAGERGAMAATACTAERAELLVRAIGDDALAIAGSNGPGQVVVSGPTPSVERFERAAAALAITTVRLRSPYAFHSPLLDPARAEFANALSQIGWRTPSRAVYSPVLGRFYQADDDIATAVAGHFSNPFDFGSAVRALRSDGVRLFVECGGRSALTRMVREILRDSAEGAWGAVACDEAGSELAVEARKQLDEALAREAPRQPAEESATIDAALVSTLRDALRADIEQIVLRVVTEQAVRPAAFNGGGHPGNGHGNAAEAHRMVAEANGNGAVPAEPHGAAAQDLSAFGEAAQSRNGAAVAEAPASRDAVLAALVELYADALEYPREVLEDDVELEADLGVDSVKQTELLARAADLFGLPPQPSDFVIGDFPTLGHIAELVLQSSPAPRGPVE
jgi:acyl transferase domain-containing protein